MDWKPKGYPDLAPYLLVRDAQAVLDFVRTVFDAPPLRVVRDGARIAHAEARVGDSVLMMGEAPDSPPSHIHLYLADPDAAFARALAAGADPVQDISDQTDGDRRGAVRAPDGTVWWLSRHATAAT
jgi:uncharacterized glyoxalase superfamily protein PhnB